MKKVNLIGKLIIAAGMINLFKKVNGFNGFGGYSDNAWTILVVSLILVIIGGTMVLISRNSSLSNNS